MQRESSGSTLGTLDRCQRPVPVSSSELVLVLDGFSAWGESTVTQVVIQTHIGSGNACNVKIGTYPVHLGVDPACSPLARRLGSRGRRRPGQLRWSLRRAHEPYLVTIQLSIVEGSVVNFAPETTP